MHRLGHGWLLAGRNLYVGMIIASAYEALIMYEALHPRAFMYYLFRSKNLLLPCLSEKKRKYQEQK